MFVCCLAARLFDSPAALYLFVSARICPPPPPLPSPNPHFPPPALLKHPSLHLACLTSDLATRIWPPIGPNRRYCLSPFFRHVLCVSLTGSFLIHCQWHQQWSAQSCSGNLCLGGFASQFQIFYTEFPI